MASQGRVRFGTDGKYSSACRNSLHDDWCKKLESSEDCEISLKLRRPKANELVKFSEVNNKIYKTYKDRYRPVKFCEHCFNELYDIYPSLGADTDDHSYDSKSTRKRPSTFSEQTAEPKISKSTNETKSPFDQQFYDDLSDDELNTVSFLVGATISKKLDRSKLDHLYRNNYYLSNIDCLKYNEEYHPALRCLVDGFTKGDCQEKAPLKGHILEKIYQLKFSNIILPLSFLQNILVYTQTNSKETVNLLAACSPSGHYDTIKEWLRSQSAEALSFPDGDCVVVFDNNQVIGRSWSVKVKNKCKSNVVTTICQIEYSGYNLQYSAALQQRNWVKDVNFLYSDVREISDSASLVHYRYLYFTLSELLKSVINEQTVECDNISDPIDVAVREVAELSAFKYCASCGEKNGKTKRNCQSCKVNLKQAHLEATGDILYGTFTIPNQTKPTVHKEVRVHVVETENGVTLSSNKSETENKLLMKHVASGHRSNPPELTVSDPCFVNPNSYESVGLILRQIGLNAGIKIYGTGERQWLFVVCDGLPYGLCKKVIEETTICLNCTDQSESFFRADAFKKHHELNHEALEPRCTKEFNWVILRPGNGHYEMNMMKSFMELNWEVFMSDLAKEMGFCSENAQKAAKSCSDNHKTWTLIETAHTGTLSELLVPYVRKCISSDVSPTPQGYIKFIAVEAKNPNYVYMSLMVLTYLQAILNMRMGVRRANTELITSAKAAFAPLFHSRNHPKYRDIEITESCQRAIVPDELKPFFDETESVSLSGDPDTGEGLDFKCEVVNREVQSWLGKGVPDGEDWLRVTRNLEKLKKLGKKAEEIYCHKQHYSGQRQRDISKQVFAWRVKLRQNEYLDQPEKECTHTSVSGAELDTELVNFQENAIKRRQEYFDVLNSDSEVNCDTPMIYVTKAEREHAENIESKSKPIICETILQMIEQISSVDYKDSLRKELEEFIHKLNRIPKSTLLMFHSKIQDVLKMQNESEDVEL